MKQLTIREFDNLPLIYDKDDFNGIKNLEVGDYYLILEKDDYIDKGMVTSVYQVINKKNDLNIESVYVMVEII